VLLDASGEHDEELARDLARLGHGRLARTVGYRDVAPAVSGLFRPMSEQERMSRWLTHDEIV